MPGLVDEDAGDDLGDDSRGLYAERICIDGGLREASFVVLKPEEEHALHDVSVMAKLLGLRIECTWKAKASSIAHIIENPVRMYLSCCK